MSNLQSPHTNSAGLAKYRGRNVRLWAKVLKFQEETAIVQASDGGEVKVKMLLRVEFYIFLHAFSIPN
ncbi:hypothetical protein Clacol_009248 [Clathrus columnatus]|uniref:Uncharacterized protein n=1 Tax=Clathrus columnatus TaxID=1419009 RepID=A0AAV5APL1_9AGAM|nr:hypothetical protein Clacol_009248 [Clathrus columnatus]